MIAARASHPEFRPILLSVPLVAAAHLALLWAALQWTPPLPVPVAAPAFAIDLEAAPASVETPSPPQPVQPPPQVRAEPEPAPPAPAPSAGPRRSRWRRSPGPGRPGPGRPGPGRRSGRTGRGRPGGGEPGRRSAVEPGAAQPAFRPTLPRAELSRWQGALLAHLERHKRYPKDARMRRQEGAATIRFVMDSSGRVLSAVLERGSGVESLDRESLALIERAQPLPLPPGGGESLDLAVPIRFQLR